MKADLPYLHLIECPHCRGPLEEAETDLACSLCRTRFAMQDGVPRLFLPHARRESAGDVTGRMRDFYDRNPFPDYDEFDSIASLMDKARRGVFARLLDEQIPFGARVLECGCGTGQLCCFLGIAHRTVFGTDMAVNSLALAQEFRRRHSLDRVFFLQMNLFRPVFKPESFDLVICNGVLHHTSDPQAGLETLTRLVRPGGHLLVGLYHRYGRLATDLRRVLIRLGGEGLAHLDPQLRRRGISKAKRRAWIADQYRNPHESKHTISETRSWLRNNRLELVKTIPKTRLGSPFRPDERLFEPEPLGNPVSRRLVEWSQALRGAGEGGFFTLIARKPC